MSDMIVRVSLVVTTGDGQVLLAESGGIPYRVLHDGNSWDIAKDMFRSLTGLAHGEWAIVRQVGFVDGDDQRWPTVLYAVELPEATASSPEEVRWADASSIIATNDHSRLLISMACQFVKVTND